MDIPSQVLAQAESLLEKYREIQERVQARAQDIESQRVARRVERIDRNMAFATLLYDWCVTLFNVPEIGSLTECALKVDSLGMLVLFECTLPNRGNRGYRALGIVVRKDGHPHIGYYIPGMYASTRTLTTLQDIADTIDYEVFEAFANALHQNTIYDAIVSRLERLLTEYEKRPV